MGRKEKGKEDRRKGKERQAKARETSPRVCKLALGSGSGHT
jgi:hypothetical protein